MESKQLRGPLKGLDISFGASIISTMLLIALASKKPEGVLGMIMLITVLVMVIAGLCFYIYLGILATRLERSWITWVGLTMLTGPFGTIFSWFWIRSTVQSMIAEDDERPDT